MATAYRLTEDNLAQSGESKWDISRPKAGMRRGKEYFTRLGAHMRVDSDSAPIEVLGTIDELNCWIGVIVSLTSSRTVRETLNFIQHDLRISLRPDQHPGGHRYYRSIM
ncbi:MAG: hypothetical protein WDN31_04000 [Hyphomicrobium sp.]